MKILYVDTSALISVAFSQNQYKTFEKHFRQAEEILSSYLIEAELYSFFSREKKPLSDAQSLLSNISLITSDRSLSLEYKMIFETGYLRGGDAYHLATALYLNPKRDEILFLSADEVQKKLAHKLGFAI